MLFRSARSSMRILSILITWALENAIDTADSMRARGYGLPGRTSYSPFKFRKNDSILLVIIIGLSSLSIYGEMAGYISFTYFPYISEIKLSSSALLLYAAYFLLTTLPMWIEIKEGIKWRLSISKI